MYCQFCGTKLKSKYCESCGKKVKKPWYKSWLFWIVIVLITSINISFMGQDTTPIEKNDNISVAEAKKEYGFSDTCINIINDYIPNVATVKNIAKTSTYSYNIEMLDGTVYLVSMFMGGDNVNEIARITTNETDYSSRTILYDFNIPKQENNIIIENNSNTVINNDVSTADPLMDTILFEQNGITIIYKGLKMDDSWIGPTLKLLVENSTNKNIIVQVRDCSVNGFMIDPTYSCNVALGKKANDEMSWFESDFEENGIVKVESIEFYFHIFDADEWETIIESNIITLNY